MSIVPPTGGEPPDSIPIGGIMPGVSMITIDDGVEYGVQIPPYTPSNYKIYEVTASISLEEGSTFVIMDATSAAAVVTLPRSGAAVGKLVVVVKKDSSANAVTFAVQTGDTLYMQSGFTGLTTQYSAATFIGINSETTYAWYKVA
jgi:hypothetical protein